MDTYCKRPTITLITKDYDMEEGQAIVLQCVATGYPPPLVEWRAPNDDIYRVTNDDFTAVIVHYDGTLLIVDGAEEGDDGTYQCVAKNKLGAEEASVTVTVRMSHSVESHGELNVCHYHPETREFVGDRVMGRSCTNGIIHETRTPLTEFKITCRQK